MTPVISRRGLLAGFLPALLGALGWSQASLANPSPAEEPPATTPPPGHRPNLAWDAVGPVTTVVYDTRIPITPIDTCTMRYYCDRRARAIPVENPVVSGEGGRGMD
jgi:hypothetical protein